MPCPYLPRCIVALLGLLLSLVLSTPARAQVNLTVNATQAVRAVDERVFGVNAVTWDGQTGSAQTISLVQAAGIRAVRIPGGSGSDVYHWSGLHPNYEAAFDSFSRLITGINGQAFTTVNYGSGTPEEAAAWVAYANTSSALLGTGSDIPIGVDSKGTDWKTAGYWSALRTSAPLGTDDGKNYLRLGRSSPFGFKYWEIGNECYGSWENDTHTSQWDPVTYATVSKAFIAKMKAVDSSIKVGVVAETGEDNLDSRSPQTPLVTNPRTNAQHKGWTPRVLATLRSLGVTPDFLIYHRYEQTPLHDTDLAHAESDATLLQKAKTWPQDASNLRQQVSDYLGAAGAGVELTVTENNSVYAYPGKQTTSLVNGLYLADSIGNVLQTEFNSLLWWDLRNGQDIANNLSSSLYGWRQYGDYGILSTPSTFGSTTAYDPYPTYYVMKLLSKFARGGDTVVQATSNNPLLSIFAAKRADGSLSLLVINKDSANAQNATIALNGYSPASSATVYSYGKPQDNAGSSADIVTSSMSISGTTFSASFDSYSATVISLPVSSPSHLTSRSDFSGDGKSDLLWTNTVTGERSMWFLNGSTVSGGGYLNPVPIAWAASATGDFDGDGKADIFWSNTVTGDRAMWLMNGTTMLTNTFMGTIPVEWVISGSGDFNGDGKADLVWTNTVTGDRAMWLMNGNTVIGGGYIGTVPVVWTISGVGDFNGDGKADLVWTNTTTGERSMWFQNGSTTIGGTAMNTVPIAWTISGVGDFNGDGKADIVLSNTATGDRVIWLMNGSTITTNAFIGTVPVAWAVSTVGDFNGDGKSDLMWTNTATGDRAMWLLNGTTVTGGGYLGTVPVEWKVNN